MVRFGQNQNLCIPKNISISYGYGEKNKFLKILACNYLALKLYKILIPYIIQYV